MRCTCARKVPTWLRGPSYHSGRIAFWASLFHTCKQSVTSCQPFQTHTLRTFHQPDIRPCNRSEPPDRLIACPFMSFALAATLQNQNPVDVCNGDVVVNCNQVLCGFQMGTCLLKRPCRRSRSWKASQLLPRLVTPGSISGHVP